MLPPHSGIITEAISTVRVLSGIRNFMPPLLLNINMIKQETGIGHWRELNWDSSGWLPLVTTTILSSAATENSHNILIAIHKFLEQPWRHFTSLELCKCSQFPGPWTRVSSTFCRWHMLKFETSYKGGKSFLPILKLLSLACVICCNKRLFFPDSVMFRHFLFPSEL